MSIEVFKRRVWRKDSSGKYVPHATNGRHVCYVETEEEARAICREANKNRPEYGDKGYFTFVYHEYRDAR